MPHIACFDLINLEYAIPPDWAGTWTDGSPTDPLIYSPARFVMPQGWTPARPPAKADAVIVALQFDSRVYSVTANFRGVVSLAAQAQDFVEILGDRVFLPAGWGQVGAVPARPV